MLMRKPIINAKDAVRQIKHGATDEALMEEYAITARGLESLFKKLVKSGEISQARLNRRRSALERSQSVVLAVGRNQPQKTIISSLEAVRAVRAGMSDLQLMEKFSLSAKGVDKLLRKLVQAGELDQTELERRMYASQFFSVVEVDEPSESVPSESVPPKPKIKSAEAVECIRSGISDTDLMQKYAISAKGLQSLFRKLVLAGEVLQAELDHRSLDGTTSLSLDTDAFFSDETVEKPGTVHQQPTEPDLLKRRISGTNLVEDIRGGVTDTALMAKYSVSAGSLDGLCTKLVEAGKIEQVELDRRMLSSQLSHFVDLEELPELSLQGQRIKSEEAVAYIRAGMSDASLMEKYQLCAAGLEALFGRLVAAGKVTRPEIDARQKGRDWAELAFGNNSEARYALKDEDEGEAEFQLEAYSFRDRIRQSCEPYAVYIKAAIGALAVTIILAVLWGPLKNFGNPWAKHPQTRTSESGGAGERQNTSPDVAAILEDIARNPLRKASFEDVPEAGALQRCLEDCKKQHASPDPADEGFLVGCRMECISKHGKAVKNIQKKYYGRE